MHGCGWGCNPADTSDYDGVSSRFLLGGSINLRIKLADGERFASDEVIQLVGGCGVKEAISDPSPGLNADGGSVVAVLIEK